MVTTIPRVMPDQFDPDPRLQALLDRLTTYYPRAIDPNLERTLRLLHDLGDPHTCIPPAIHIAGTNGKGSTLATIRAITKAAGLTSHVMTSPHLVRFNERLVISGTEMTTPAILDLMEEVERINNGTETTSFEIITAAGFLEFSRRPSDLSLIEVGMGGRFDATNVIEKPLASIITVISRDHTKFLGTALTNIAREKAGIIKTGCPVIIGPQTSEGLRAGVMDVFTDTAQEHGCPLFRHGHEWSFDVTPEGFILHTPQNIYEFPRPNLRGDHQIGNAATAAMTLLAIEDKLPKPLRLQAFEKGITTTIWPGRLQKIIAGHLRDLAPPQWEIWIDGGHNDTGGQVLAREAQRWQDKDGKPLHLILGMLSTKDPCEFAAPLAPYAASTSTITIPDQPLALSNDDLAAQLQKFIRKNICAASSLENAVKNITAAHLGSGRILITGSLYLMGAILTGHTAE
ncbi:MAG: Mur ligase family protein [Pseudobdellovibrionaceae bacterium]